MDQRNVDFLRTMLRRFPRLGTRLRLRPVPSVKRHGAWRRLKAAFPAADGLRLLLSDGSRLTLAADARASERLRFQHEMGRVAGAALHPWRPLRTLAATDRMRGHTAAVVRLLLAGPGEARALALAARPRSHPSFQARLLTSALLWWSQRCQGGRRPRQIFLFIPRHWGRRIIEILPHLALPIACWEYDVLPGGGLDPSSLKAIYPSVFLRAALNHPYVMHPYRRRPPAAMRRLSRRHPDLDLLFRRSRWELSYLGYPVAWQPTGGEVRFGDEPGILWEPSRARCLSEFLERLKRRRRACPERRGDPFQRYPERWMESLMLKRPSLIHPRLRGEIYCQVPTSLESDRAVVDALGRLRGGRLAVIEFKVEKDFNLLLQGLDYWDRVRRHLGRGDFQQAGYFRGRRLSPRSPLLILVSPLFQFHRLLPALRGYLTSELEVVCVGVNDDWRRRLKVVRRISLGRAKRLPG
ncbi:MAG TPA: hypothetical protein VLU25_08895 [Acidobacteriota bacterium]|nr:hypothetical protein [Acidobacteriota bacterium]